jgi:hypothetical protein
MSLFTTVEYEEEGLGPFAAALMAPGQSLGENGEVGVTSGPGGGVTAVQEERGQALEASVTDLSGLCTRDLPKSDQNALVHAIVEKLPVEMGSVERAKAISLVVRLLFNLRDIRGGKGERMLSYRMLLQLCREVDQELVISLIHLFVESFGSYGDLVKLHRMAGEVHNKAVQAACIDIFVEQHAADVAALKADGKDVSLCAKWMPREKGSTAKLTTEEARHQARMARELAVVIFLRGLGDEAKAKQLRPDGKLKLKAKKFARMCYRKSVAELSKHLKVVEQKMCAKNFASIDPKIVPAVAGKKYRKAFQNLKLKTGEQRSDDPDRVKCAENFEKVLQRAIETGEGIKGSVSGAHGIAKPYVNRSNKDKMLEAQWSVLVKEAMQAFAEGGGLPKALALVDVSGSMGGVPMEVAVALGLLVAELGEGVWKDLVLTFHEDPTFFKVQGDSLHARVRHLMSAPWGGSTNFAKAINMILAKAIEHKVPADQMPEIMFVFSDMQFDVANSSRSGYGGMHAYRSGARDGKTGYQHAFANIKRAYAEAGYAVPHIVFWNLRGECTSKPCETISEGVSTMSGYSDAMLKAFMSGKIQDFVGETPWDRVKAILDDERYAEVDAKVMAHYGF